MSWFPMFVDLAGRKCLVAGGGKIALRKIQVLREFGADLTVVAPRMLPEIGGMEGILRLERKFAPQDLEGQDLVVAATDGREENHRIAGLCRKAGIPVNAVDQPEDCDFIFPAWLKQGEVVAAFSSGGQSPVLAQYLKERMSPVMTPLLGEIAACLGGLRQRVGQCVEEGDRKKVYRELLSLALEEEALPTEEEIERIIGRYAG